MSEKHSNISIFVSENVGEPTSPTETGFASYAKNRIKTYIGRFTKLYSQIKKNEIDENFLKDIQEKDCVFPDIDYHIYTKL